MKIVSVELVVSATEPPHFPRENLPEVAFLGRSNVGKSSLINSLLDQRKVAFTSNTPGRTQQINFFRVNRKFFFVDLPGYGYAKALRSLRESWGELIQSYLQGRRQLTVSILIVDSRIGPTRQDLQKLEWLRQRTLPFFIVSTKADKLSQVELHKSLTHTQSICSDARVIAYSAVQDLGYSQVWTTLQPYINMKPASS